MLFKRKQTLSVDDTPLKSEKQRRTETDLAALRLQVKNTSKVKVYLAIITIITIISPLICARIMSNTERFTDFAAERFHLATANKPGRQAALQNVNRWLTSKDTPFQSGYANLWWVDAQLVNTVAKNAQQAGGAGSGNPILESPIELHRPVGRYDTQHRATRLRHGRRRIPGGLAQYPAVAGGWQQ